MSIEGNCVICGGMTIDYGCVKCITGDRDALAVQVEALREVCEALSDVRLRAPHESIEEFAVRIAAFIGTNGEKTRTALALTLPRADKEGK